MNKPFKNYREESKKGWGTVRDDELSPEQIQLGALLRIADASEKMEQRHTELIADRDRYEAWFQGERRASVTLARQLAAAKGQITKLKRALATSTHKEYK